MLGDGGDSEGEIDPASGVDAKLNRNKLVVGESVAVISVAKNTSVDGVVTGIWPEVVGKIVFDDSITGVGLEDSLVKIDPTIIVDVLLSSLEFIAEMFTLTEDPEVSVGLTLLWVIASENIIEAGNGEIMGVKN